MRIGIDIDGVLADFNRDYIERCITVTGRDLFPPRPFDIVTWNYPESYGYSAWEVGQVWDNIKRDPTFWQTLHAYPHTWGALTALCAAEKAGNEIYFITARPGTRVKDQTEVWLRAHHFMFPTVLISSAKGQCVQALQLDRYIDDRIENVLDTVQHCETYLLDRPWNRDLSDPRITRVTSVEAILP